MKGVPMSPSVQIAAKRAYVRKVAVEVIKA